MLVQGGLGVACPPAVPVLMAQFVPADRPAVRRGVIHREGLFGLALAAIRLEVGQAHPEVGCPLLYRIPADSGGRRAADPPVEAVLPGEAAGPEVVVPAGRAAAMAGCPAD